MINTPNIPILLAEAYKQAALASAPNMHLAADLLENIRKNLIGTNPYIIWDFIALDQSKFENETSIEIIQNLKGQYYNAFYENILTEIENLFLENKEKALIKWQLRFAEAIAYIKPELASMLCIQKENWGMPDAKAEQLYNYVKKDYWIEAYPFILEMAADPNFSDNNELMASIEVILAEIVLFNFPSNSSGKNLYQNKAIEHINNAESWEPNLIRTLRGKAELEMKVGDASKARELFFQLISKQEYDYLSYVLIGDSYFANDEDLSKAEYWYYEAIAKNFVLPDGYDRLIKLYSKKDNFKKDKFNDLLNNIKKFQTYNHNQYFIQKKWANQSSYESNWEFNAYLNMADGFVQMGELPTAQNYNNEAHKLNPTDALPIINDALIFNKENTKNILENALAKQPLSFDLNWALAEYYKEKEPNLAQVYYEKCIEIRPFWKDYLSSFIGLMHFNAQNYKAAEHWYRLAYNINPTQDDYALSLADAIFELTKTLEIQDETLLIEAEKIASERNSPLFFENLGLYFEEKAKAAPTSSEIELINKKAEEAYFKAIEIDKEKSHLYPNRLGIFLYNQSRFDESIIAYKNALEIAPNDTVILGNIGLSFEANNQFEQAIPYYQKIAELSPDSAAAINSVGLIYFKAKNFGKAAEYFSKAQNIESQNVTYHTNLATAYRENNEIELAIKAFIIVNDLNPNDFYNWNELGVLYLNTQQNELAQKCFEKSIALNSENKTVKRNLSIALNAIGVKFYADYEDEKAAEYYEKAIELCTDDPIYYKNLIMALVGLQKNTEAFSIPNREYISPSIKADLDIFIKETYPQFIN